MKILKKELQAALLFASTDETRYVLNGVFFDCRKGKRVRMIATNGHVLAVIQSEADGSECDTSEQFIVSRGALDPFTKWGIPQRAKTMPRIVTITPGEKKMVTLELDGVTWTTEGIIEGNYPNWKHLVKPAEMKNPRSPTAVSTKYFKQLAEALRLLNYKNDVGMVMRQETSESPVEIRFPGAKNIWCILMPLRAEITEWQPDFVKE